jgi:serine protease Do
MSTEITSEKRTGKRVLTFLIILFVLGAGIGIGTLITYRVGATGPGDSQLKVQTDGKPLIGNAVLGLSQAFADVAKRVEPAVVNINTEEVVKVSNRQIPQQEEGDDPMDLFRQWFGGQGMPDQYTRSSLGTGVIVDPKGYIITNYHVVSSATKIKVSVKDDKEYPAKVIAGDELSDIAVIKIDSPKNFPTVSIGDAKAMKVGDWVLAIGSPFGLEQTVTAGIISAIGRTFGSTAEVSLQMLFNDYLQTDAAINPGNSGGPLVNMNGEVVGINSFISTSSRSNAGVGFAVPSHIFVNVYNQIIDKGKVLRGWLGVNMNTLPFTPAMAKYFGVNQGSGVLITGLTDENGDNAETGPAAKAGIKPEDVITEFDGKKVTGVQDFRMAVASTPPGQKVNIKVVRHGTEQVFQAALGERKIEEQQKKGPISFDAQPEAPKAELGLSIDNVTSRMAQSLNISGGALVLEVKAGSLAEEAGLEGQSQTGSDIIVEANGKKIETAQDLLNLVKSLRSGEDIVLKFIRYSGSNSATFFTSLTKP